MIEVLVVLVIVMIFLLVIILIKQFSNKVTDISPQMLDLRNKIDDLKTKQLESQTNSLSQQQTLLVKTQTEIRSHLTDIMKNIEGRLSSSQNSITSQLRNSNESINHQLKTSNQVIGEIQKNLGTLETTTRNIQDISKDISSLQDILRAPKLRGNLGEYLLEQLLKDIFPKDLYQIKYSFNDGTQVDAVIKIAGRIVPIDSKFPLESFKRLTTAKTDEDKKRYKKEFVISVRNRIDEISKYRQTSDKTFDFVMMYIPAENVFYETLTNDSLTSKEYEIFNYAIEKRVVITSPNSFYTYLITIIWGLKGFQIEQKAKTIMGEITRLQGAFENFYTEFTKLGKHIGHASVKYNDLNNRANTFNRQMTEVTGIKNELIESTEVDN